MKVLGRDDSRGSIVLEVTTLDDLWHLANLLSVGDIVRTTTVRTPDLPGSTDRHGKPEKKPMTLSVRVEKVEHAPFAQRLRVLGPIVEGPQDLGRYHALGVEEGSRIEVRKERGWSEAEIERLEEALSSSRLPRTVVLSMEEGEALLVGVHDQGVRVLAEIQGGGSGKRDPEGRSEEDFFEEILLALSRTRGHDQPLLLVGPGFAKERFLRFAKERSPAAVEGAFVEGTGNAGMRGVFEAIQRGWVERGERELRLSRELEGLERLFRAMGSSLPYAVGVGEVRQALERGACDLLLLTDELFRRPEGREMMDLARRTKAKPLLVSTAHEGGVRLRALGGAAALLRYAIDLERSRGSF